MSELPAVGTWAERAADAVVSVFSPSRAWRRRLARALDREHGGREVLDAFMRAHGYRHRSSGQYAHAQTKGTQSPWDFAGRGYSPDADLSGALPDLRARSRAANRNDALAAGVSLTRENNVIGTGLTPQAQVLDEDSERAKRKNDALEAVWADAARALDPVNGGSVGAAQRLKLRKYDEDGEVLSVRAIRGGRIWFEVIEGDRIESPPGYLRAPGTSNRICDGVEKDADGVPVAYWVRSGHQVEINTTGSTTYRRVPAEQCKHVKRTHRPGQSRGLPGNSSCLQDYRDLDLLMLATLKRSQVAACLAAFIKTTYTADGTLPVIATEFGYDLEQALEPGMMYRLNPGEELQQLTPSVGFSEFEPLIIMSARRIGAARGMSWQAVLRDWSGSTYSSARTQILEDRITYQVDRGELACLFSWEWEQVQTYALLRGDERLVAAGVEIADVSRVAWTAPGWQWVDPQKEAAATKENLGMGLTTKRDEAAAQGRDWEDLITQQLIEEQYERAERKRLGLPTMEEAAAAKAAASKPAGGAVAAPPADDESARGSGYAGGSRPRLPMRLTA